MWQPPFNGKPLQTAKTQCDTFKKIGARAVMLSGIIEKKGGIPEKGYFQLYFGVHKNFTQTKNIEDSQKCHKKRFCASMRHILTQFYG